MKLSKILATVTLLIMMFNLAACDQLYFHTGKHTGGGQGGGSGKEEQKEQPITYVYSVTQKVLHLPDCYHVEDMNEEYRFEYSGDISELFEKGYTICKDCLVSDDPEEEEHIPDEDEVPAEEATFVINRSKLRIHHLDCYHIEDMKEENIKYTNLTLEELLAKDHIPCGTCMPEEYEEYEKAHPDE